MNKNLYNIDKLFKTALEGVEDEPSSNVWESIDKDLDKKKVVSISKKYRKLKFAASFLLIFSIGMAMYILQVNRKNKVQLKENHDTITLNDKNDKKETIRTDAEQGTTIPDSNASIQKEISSGKTIPFYDSSSHNSGATTVRNKNIIKQLPATIAKISTSKEIPSSVSKLKPPKLNSDERNLNAFDHSIKDNHKDGNFDKADLNKTNGIIAKKDEQKFDSDKLSESFQAQNTPVLVVPLSDPEMIMYKKIFLNSLNISNSNPQKYTGVKNKISKPLHESRFNATVFFSPDIVSYNIKSDQPQFEEDAKNEIRKDEKSQFANSFGVLAGYKINRNWIIQSGVMISNRVTGIDSKTIYARPDRNGNVNFRLSCFTGPSYIPLKSGIHPAPGDSTIVSAKNALRYISIPIVLQYRITKGRLSISPGAGIGANFLLINKIESIINTANGYQASVTNTGGLRSAYFNSFLTLNAAYKIGNRIAFSFTPVAQVGLSSITQDGPVKTMLNSFGFEAGMSIDL